MKKNKSVIFILGCIIFILFTCNVNGQDTREKIGSEDIIKNGTNYYNYADKDKVNIEVSVWGYVKNPGKYLIPSGTTIIDLITLCGGPLTDSKMEDVRLIRLKNDSLKIKNDKVILLNFKDFLGEEKIKDVSRENPILIPGDIILIPGVTKSTFKENFALILGSVSTLTSIAVLIVTIFRK